MKNYINFWIAAFVFLLFSFEGKTQCPPGNLNFTHQQDVDNFAIQYPDCTQIAGTLTIEGSNITNLNGLSNITTIGGDLRIWHTTQLPDMEGLNELTLIEGDLNFFNNSGIQRMDGLESLARIGANFDFYINPALQDLSALRSLVQIGGFLQLAQSPQLADISALQHIDPASIGGSGLHITDNANLAVCNLPNFCTYLSGPGPRNIYGNKTTCLDATAVTNACSVACPAGDVTFTTQQQVNDFGAMYAHCTDIILNSLTIGFLLGPNATDITDLTPLQNISSINGTLYIYNNPLLSDLNGLNGLMGIGGLNVYKNATLENINALNSITQIGGVVNFDSNPHLQNLDGLSSVESIGGYLYIANNNALTQLNGLSSLQSIGAFMEIRNNPSLTDLDGLNNLTSIGGHLSIRINNSLTNLNGLSNLTSIGGHLSIQSNAALTDISSLQNIDPETITGANGLSIITNPNLSVCNLPNFCAYLQGSGSRTISGNKTTCLNEAAVQAECAPCETPGNLSVEHLHSSTVTLAWEGEAEHFELEWGTAGFGLGNGSPVAGIEETSYPLSGLSANTAYEFYVRADCGDGQSEWAGPFGFTTLIQSNSLYGFGQGNGGQLGLGNTDNQNIPVKIGIAIWKQITAGDLHSLGIQEDGTLWAWGDGNMGRLGTGNQENQLLPIQIGESTWKCISAGYAHTLGIKTDGTIWAWGEGSNGRLGTGNDSQQNTPVQVGSGNWQNISAGSYHSLAIKSDGTLWAWGGGMSGQLGIGSNSDQQIPVQVGNQTWLHISAGENHSLAIKTDGTLWAWGEGSSGQLGTGDTEDRNVPVQIGTDTWLYVDGGRTHSLGIKSDGTLWAWGSGDDGRLGSGNTETQLSPVMISNETWSYVTTGHFHSLAIKSDGSLWSWGAGGSGRLGTGNAENQLSPVQVTIGNYSLVAGGGYHSLALGKLPCALPEDLGVENLQSNSVDLTWEGEAEHFELEWGTAGFDLGNGNLVTSIEGTSYPLSGLSANTAYEFYVRADCGDGQSEWVEPFGFTTLGECPSGSFTFTTQQQIDDFAAMYAHCTDITIENLIIQGADITNLDGLSNVKGIGYLEIKHNSSLTNLDDLSNVTHIQGDIIIWNNAQLTNLDGLSNVTNIGGRLIIENNDALTNINGLANFTHIQGDIIITNNSSLTDVDGLSGLTNITSSLRIGNNYSLSNLNGLSGITNIAGNLAIDANSVMTNIDGLNNLTSIGGDLWIQSNVSLTNLNGLNNLSDTGGSLYIIYNSQLTHLDGLTHLSSIGGNLTILGNAALTDISGLQNIDPSTIGETFGLRIVNNPLLGVCNLPNFCAYLQGSGSRAISGNAGDCISEAAVLDACDLSGNCDSYTLWDGFVWSNGLPDSSKKAIIDGDFVLNADLEACELEVTTNGSLEIPPGITLTVYGTVANYASAGEFIVSNDANLIQSNEAENSGSVTVKRESNPMIRLDYTLWSSPVVGQNLFGFSPETVNGVTNYPGSTGRIYVYEGTNGYVNPDPFTETAVMNGGAGYLFRAPNNWSATEPEPYIGVFTGVPNNGNIVATTYTGNYTSIGNPYPSNIILDEFFTVNPGINAVYFWNNNHSAGNNYAACTNGIGCVAAAGGGNTPGGIITPGQGFIVHTDHSSVTFTNEMRTGDNGTFFKVDELESHRFWLNLNGENEKPYNQILVGYVSEATNGVDNQIDGKIFGYEGSALYSIIENEKLVIQGRALPFEASDVVPLGFKAAENGKFKISLANFDGLFAEDPINIYLKDNELNIAHDLMVSAYDFESNAGEFNERFEIIFGVDGVMGMDSQGTPEIRIYTEKEYIVVDSKTEKILSVELYGLEGKSLYRNDKVNAKHYKIKSSSFGPRVLVIKTKTINGETLTKKIINK